MRCVLSCVHATVMLIWKYLQIVGRLFITVIWPWMRAFVVVSYRMTMSSEAERRTMLSDQLDEDSVGGSGINANV